MISYFVPAELQRRRFQENPLFAGLANRAFKPMRDGVQLAQPWSSWRGISTYLACAAFADRSAQTLPRGKDLNLEHVTPGQFYSAGVIFFSQAMMDNIADWLSDALPLSVKGGDRNFLEKTFTRELKFRFPASSALLSAHDPFLNELNRYRQVWIHTLAGGAIPVADDDPFSSPESASKFLGVPIDPAINPDEESYAKRAEQCAAKNAGRYLYEIGEFTSRIFEGATRVYCDWLRFALDSIK